MPRRSLTINIKGLAATKKKAAASKAATHSAAAQALRLEGEEIMARAKDEFVPVNLGNLRASGHVADVEIEPDGSMAVRLAFGGAAAPYALAVHEHPSPHSPPSWQGTVVEFSPPGRGPKYLERPMVEAQAGMAQRIGERMRRATK